jgi:hypothetical protein
MMEFESNPSKPVVKWGLCMSSPKPLLLLLVGTHPPWLDLHYKSRSQVSFSVVALLEFSNNRWFQFFEVFQNQRTINSGSLKKSEAKNCWSW